MDFFVLTVYFFVIIISLCVGSFLNVVILRAFSGESIVLPPSKCPKCHEKLKWYDNIPVLSYIMLGAKCRYCAEKISIQYPMVELATAVLFFVIFRNYGLSVDTLFLWSLVGLGIVMAVTDIKEQVIFNVHSYSFIAIAFLYNIYRQLFFSSLVGSLFGVLAMELFALIGFLIAKKRAFGEGDTFLAAGIGALLGLRAFVFVLVLSMLIQAVYILPVYLKKMWKKGEKYFTIMLVSFFVVIILYKVLELNNLLSPIGTLLMLGLIIVLAYISCVKLLRFSASGSELSYFPFGPSLLLSAFFVYFWEHQIIHLLKVLI